MSATTKDIHDRFEPRPDVQKLAGENDARNVSTNVDYEPHPERSLNISEEHQTIIQHITNLYSGSCDEGDMEVYAGKAIYDDPYSYCDTRYKIAGACQSHPGRNRTARQQNLDTMRMTS